MLKGGTDAGEIQIINKINLKTLDQRTTPEQEEKQQHSQQPREQREWNIRATNFALNTVNPIREIVDNLNVQPNEEKSFIPLSVGKSFRVSHIVSGLTNFFFSKNPKKNITS